MAFDTSAAHCAAALVSEIETCAYRSEDMTRGQAEALFPMLEAVLADAKKSWRDIDLIAVGTGPGNFTGIRIAVSAARGLSMSLEVPAIGVTTLEALVDPDDGQVWATVPAPRDQVYLQRFSPAQGTIRLLDVAAAKVAIDQDPAPVVGALARQPILRPDPQAIARAARRRTQSGDAIVPPKATYVRAADAAPSKEPAPVILS